LTRRDGESDADYLARGLATDQDPKILKGFPALIFVCKRHAKEPITVAEAGEVGFGDFQFIPEEADVVVEPDPTTANGSPPPPFAGKPNGSKPRNGSGARKSSTPRSRTSKATSTAG
jgi:hypothetical protein